MKFDNDKLESTLSRMESSVRQYCSGQEGSRAKMAGEILGYWFYELRKCGGAEGVKLGEAVRMERGRRAYETFREQQTTTGPRAPKLWSELEPGTREAWCEIVRAALAE